MPRKLIDFSEAMFNHTIDFQRHYKIPTLAEAIRTLWLAGFAHYGNPLDESPRMLRQFEKMQPIRKEQPSIDLTPYENIFNKEPIYTKEEIEEAWKKVNGG